MNLLNTNPLTMKSEMSAERQLRTANGIIAVMFLIIVGILISNWIGAANKVRHDKEVRLQQERDKAQIAILEDENELLRKELKSLNTRVDQLIAISKRSTTVNHYYYFYEGELVEQETEKVEWTQDSPDPHTMQLPRTKPFERREEQ